MKNLWIKYAKNILSFKDIDVYLVAGLNLSIVVGIITGRNQFFNGAFGSILILSTIALLLTNLFEKITYKIGNKKKNKNLIIAVSLECLMLFVLASLPATVNSFFILLQVLAALTVQYFVIVLSCKVFKTELARLAIFTILTGAIIYKGAINTFSSARTKLDTAKNAHVQFPQVLSLKKIKPESYLINN